MTEQERFQVVRRVLDWLRYAPRDRKAARSALLADVAKNGDAWLLDLARGLDAQDHRETRNASPHRRGILFSDLGVDPSGTPEGPSDG